MLDSPVRIAIVGDWDRTKLAHFATDAALYHAAAQARLPLELTWVGTDVVRELGAPRALRHRDGIFGAPGSPFASLEGMLDAIRFARESDIPYLGTCAGFQYALIEYCRNVLGIADADSAENASGSQNIVITPVSCPLPDRPAAAPALAGKASVLPVAASLLAEICDQGPLTEEYFCNFETNPAYLDRWQAAGLAVAARDERGEVRAVSLPANRFFLATLFQPQRASLAGAPHPILQAFLRECAESEPRSQRAPAVP